MDGGMMGMGMPPMGMGMPPMGMSPPHMFSFANHRKKSKEQKERSLLRKRTAVEKSKHTVARQRVLLSRAFGTGDKGIVLMEYAGIDVDGAPLLEGFPSVGLLSVIVAKTLIQELDLPLVAAVAAADFPIGCSVRNGQPSYPVQIYGDKRLVVFSCDFKLPPKYLHFFVEAILDFAKRHDSSMIYCVEGKPDFDEAEKMMTMMMGGPPPRDMMPPMPSAEFQQRLMPAPVPFVGFDASLSDSDNDENTASGREHDYDYYAEETVAKRTAREEKRKIRKEKIHFLTTCETTAARLRELRAYPIVEGNIDGVTGGLLAMAPTTDAHVTAVLGKASGMYPDARSAARLLKLLLQLIQTLPEVDTSYLEEEAQELEESLTKLAISTPTDRRPFGMYN